MAGFRALIQRHPLIRTLLEIRGNVRCCVWLEPLWGIPYNLYAPYATLYMYAFGVTDEKIGLLLSIGMVFQVLASLLGGLVTDKLGRRTTTVIFDVLSWSFPCLIWIFAQNFWWFFAATLLNSLWKITDNSWSCLLVEDCDAKMLVNVYSLVTISGLLAVFFAPISSFLVGHFSMVPVMRALYAFAFLSMTAKFLLLYFFGTETEQGKIRMQETKHVKWRTLLFQYKDIMRHILHSPPTLTLLFIMALTHITTTLTSNFFGLYVTQNLGIDDALVALFPMARAGVMLLFLFVMQPAIERLPFKKPMLWGIFLYLLSMILLLATPDHAGSLTMASLVAYILCEAFAYALLIPRKDSLTVLFVDPSERARIMGLLYVMMIAAATPFGWLGGWLSSLDRTYPFILCFVLYALTGLVILRSRPMSHDLS